MQFSSEVLNDVLLNMQRQKHGHSKGHTYNSFITFYEISFDKIFLHQSGHHRVCAGCAITIDVGVEGYFRDKLTGIGVDNRVADC